MPRAREVTLRPWEEADLEVLHAIRNDVPLQLALLAEPNPNSMQDVIDWLQRRSRERDTVFFVIASESDNRALGFLQAIRIDLHHRRCYVGICLHPSHQKKGVGEVAITLLEDFMVRVHGIRKFLLEVSADNANAIRLYRRLAYREVGVLRQHFRSDGGLASDVMIMEKLCPG